MQDGGPAAEVIHEISLGRVGSDIGESSSVPL